MFKISLMILLLSVGCSKKIRGQFPPEEKRYLVRVLITTEASLTYKCDNVRRADGYATDCEDNEGRALKYLVFKGNVTEIVDRQEEIL